MVWGPGGSIIELTKTKYPNFIDAGILACIKALDVRKWKKEGIDCILIAISNNLRNLTTLIKMNCTRMGLERKTTANGKHAFRILNAAIQEKAELGLRVQFGIASNLINDGQQEHVDELASEEFRSGRRNSAKREFYTRALESIRGSLEK